MKGWGGKQRGLVTKSYGGQASANILYSLVLKDEKRYKIIAHPNVFV